MLDKTGIIVYYDVAFSERESALSGCSAAGSVLGSGPRGRGFKSRHSDHVVADFVSFATTFSFIKQTLPLIRSVAPPFHPTNASLVCGMMFQARSLLNTRSVERALKLDRFKALSLFWSFFRGLTRFMSRM